jgi:hypothetical protein
MESPAIAVRQQNGFFTILKGVGYLICWDFLLLSHFARPLSIPVWRGLSLAITATVTPKSLSYEVA